MHACLHYHSTHLHALCRRAENGEGSQSAHHVYRWWVVGGLGARGLVYHAWLGELIAQAVLNDSEEGLPKELLRWQACRVEVPTEK